MEDTPREKAWNKNCLNCKKEIEAGQLFCPGNRNKLCMKRYFEKKRKDKAAEELAKLI